MSKIIDRYGEEITADSVGDDVDNTCDHEWADSEVGCEDCGSHSAVRCENCDAILDLVYHDDPRGE